MIFVLLYHRLIFVYKLSRLSWHYTCPHSRLLQASYNNNNKMATTQATPNLQPVDREKIYIWINELTNPETRESALFELRYARQNFFLGVIQIIIGFSTYVKNEDMIQSNIPISII